MKFSLARQRYDDEYEAMLNALREDDETLEAGQSLLIKNRPNIFSDSGFGSDRGKGYTF